jgi:hypothetical protein
LDEEPPAFAGGFFWTVPASARSAMRRYRNSIDRQVIDFTYIPRRILAGI